MPLHNNLEEELRAAYRNNVANGIIPDSLGSVVMQDIAANQASGKAIDYQEVIDTTIEQAKQDMTDLGSFIHQNITDPTDKATAIAEWLANYQTSYNPDTNQAETWYINPNTKEKQLDYKLHLSYQNLKGNLVIPASLQLAGLDCGNNQLTNLDLSANTALTTLSCYNNQLTNLDLSANTALTTLSCSNNQLTNLDLSANTALTMLSCYDNQLTDQNKSQIKKLLPRAIV